MLAAVDSSVLIDVLTNDPAHSATSLAQLRKARDEGALIVCPIVWAEMRALFDNADGLHNALDRAGIRFDPFDAACAELSGEMWSEYRKSGGSRTRLIPDFLIGAHAIVRGGRLVTRDRGFFRRYFTGLACI
jgi:hypothetical protein